MCQNTILHRNTGETSQNLLIDSQLVSSSLTSPFSTNMAISETKGQGRRAISTQWRKASDIRKVDEKRKKGKGNKEQKMRKWMDKGGAKAERGYPGPTRGYLLTVKQGLLWNVSRRMSVTETAVTASLIEFNGAFNTIYVTPCLWRSN